MLKDAVFFLVEDTLCVMSVDPGSRSTLMNMSFNERLSCLICYVCYFQFISVMICKQNDLNK